jgi:arginyl-tRNA synthetase
LFGGGVDMTISEILTAWIRPAVKEVCAGIDPDLSALEVVPTGSPEFGDYQCNAAMALAKQMKMAPRQIARRIADSAKPHEGVAKVEIAGPGFLNIYLKDDWLKEYLGGIIADPRIGVPPVGVGKTVVMDYGGPNMCKPLHIGHLRSPNIGSVLDRLYRLLGCRVVADSHLGDWGTQFGIIIMGYRNFGNDNAMTDNPLAELERVYVLSYERTKTDEKWSEQCRQELVKLQAGDPANVALWRQFIEWSRREVDSTYNRLGFTFDLVRGESYYNDMLKGIVEDMEKKGLARESEGATVVFLEEEKLPVCIVRKRDGGFNYASTDLATIMSRVSEFSPERIIYVTDERQQLHFRQLFAICRRLGVATLMDHVWFGLMRLPDATFSTREGNVIPLDKLLDEAESRALEIVKKTSPDMPAARQRDVARAVGIGAVKYADLSQNPQTLVTFTWEKALALDGNSGPYLQYAYARIASVRDKYAEKFPGIDPDSHPLVFSEPVERSLALKAARFPEVAVRAAFNYRPNFIADYLYDLAQTYSNFYQNVPFLKAEEGLRESRVRLCGMVAKIIGKCLHLLGIETPERI